MQENADFLQNHFLHISVGALPKICELCKLAAQLPTEASKFFRNFRWLGSHRNIGDFFSGQVERLQTLLRTFACDRIAASKNKAYAPCQVLKDALGRGE